MVRRSVRVLSRSRSSRRDPGHRNPRYASYRHWSLRGRDGRGGGGRHSADSNGLRTSVDDCAADRARSLRRPPRPTGAPRSDGSERIVTAWVHPTRLAGGQRLAALEQIFEYRLIECQDDAYWRKRKSNEFELHRFPSAPETGNLHSL